MSTEYPDLAWVPPKAWRNANRTTVQVVIIHTTEGAANGTAAENGAAYDQERTDGTSTHYFHDSNSTIQCVRTEDIAYAARTQGNLRGIQHELCTRAGSAIWTDAYHTALLARAAKQTARDCSKWNIPVRRISSGQIPARLTGICGHVDATHAFRADGGTHTDPGAAFPWARFISLVQAEFDKLKGDDMDLTPQNLKDIADAVAARLKIGV